MISGRAVFAECPRDPTLLSIEEGQNVTFSTTVIHIGGGSCGFQQEIKQVQLMKINPEVGADDELLLACAISDSSLTLCRNSRVSLSRGNDPGFEFVFTLVDTVMDMDSLLYIVIVEVTDPATNSFSSFGKIFHVKAGMTIIS